METNSANTGNADAQKMLDVFASVEATHFDVTLTTRSGEKDWYRRSVSLTELRRTMLAAAATGERNVIVRPHGPGVSFIQLDDLKSEKLAVLAPAVFLTLETSRGNFQAWVALAMPEDKDFARRLRKGVGADATASGATRVAGSLNFKDKYAPDFPRISIQAAQAGRVTNAAELERLGLVAVPERFFARSPLSPARSRPGPDRRKWPSYARCVDGAPLNSEETGPDISRADFVFCMTAITWGWSPEDAADRLMEESTKAQANGKAYAELTARNAALAVDRRSGQPGRHQVLQCGRR